MATNDVDVSFAVHTAHKLALYSARLCHNLEPKALGCGKACGFDVSSSFRWKHRHIQYLSTQTHTYILINLFTHGFQLCVASKRQTAQHGRLIDDY